ncbi:MAG: hypothetical protein ACLR0U_21230 [Enterocloster clostridioformis]
MKCQMTGMTWITAIRFHKLTFHAEAVPVEEHDSALGVQSQWNMVVQEDSSGVLTWSQGIRAGE